MVCVVPDRCTIGSLLIPSSAEVERCKPSPHFESDLKSNSQLACQKSSAVCALVCCKKPPSAEGLMLPCASHCNLQKLKPQTEAASVGSANKPSEKGGHVITPNIDDLLKGKDEKAECPATEGASAAGNSELLVNRASQFLDGIHKGCLSALPMPLLPGVPSLKMTLPEPLYRLPSVTAENLSGGRTEHPGYQFDLQRMRQLGFPEKLLQSLRFGVRFNFTSDPQKYYSGNHLSSRSTAAAKQVVHDDLLRLYNLGKLSDCGVDRPFVVNPLGLVLKPEKVRVVVDASISGINDMMNLIYFPLPTAVSAVKMMKKGCWMAKLDVHE